MKIVDTTDQPKTPKKPKFSDLKGGDCFLWAGPRLFTKLKEVVNDGNGGEYNAVELEDGDPYFMDDRDDIVPVQAEAHYTRPSD